MGKYILNLEFSVEDETQRENVMRLVGELMNKVYDGDVTFPITKLNFEVREDE